MNYLILLNKFQSTVIATNPLHQAHFASKSLSKDPEVLFVSHVKYLPVEHLIDYQFQTGDGRWRQVIRRCASVADTGVTGVCNWGVKENGVYWEECYCAQDGCNNSSALSTSLVLITLSLLLSYTVKQVL